MPLDPGEGRDRARNSRRLDPPVFDLRAVVELAGERLPGAGFVVEVVDLGLAADGHVVRRDLGASDLQDLAGLRD